MTKYNVIGLEDFKERSCKNKTKYKKPSNAIKIIKLQEKNLIHPRALDIYECLFCKHWHIGHPVYRFENTKLIKNKHTNI